MTFATLQIISRDVNATIAAGASETWEFLDVPSLVVKGEVVEVSLTNGGALTGHATNYLTADMFNVTGNVTMATRAVDTPTTDDITADTPWDLVVSTTVAYKKFVAGDAIRVRKTEAGTGMALTVPARFQGTVYLNGTYD